MIINNNTNSQSCLLPTSNLRKILKDKARSIREQRFNINNYSYKPEISPSVKTKSSKSFQIMLHRVTNITKE